MGLGGWEVALTTIAARNRRRSTFIFIFDYVENEDEAGVWRMRMRMRQVGGLNSERGSFKMWLDLCGGG